ncbi:MAG: NADH-quinone oxidoreductase subunit I [Dehalococcoidia bacterium]|nr:NADH-quinone oxidoreductase subunit I [Dehalococcoidia bacterium]
MLNSLRGLLVTLKTFVGKPVTAQYPTWHLPVQESYMGFPVLTWDAKVGEPYCVACMVCIRMCPTQCMSATMKDNPLHKEGKSHRRKMVESFAINLGRCIVCGICEEVCAFDAITMSHIHEMGTFARNGRRVEMDRLLELGKGYQKESGWRPPTELEKEKQAALKAAQPATATATAEAAGGSPVASPAPKDGAS